MLLTIATVIVIKVLHVTDNDLECGPVLTRERKKKEEKAESDFVVFSMIKKKNFVLHVTVDNKVNQYL